MSAPAPAPGPAPASQLEAMVSLLSDTNDVVRTGSAEALVAQGRAAEPLLLARLGQARGEEHLLIRRLLARIRRPATAALLLEHLLHEPDLERGSILIGRLVDGGDAPEGVTPALDAMADQVRARLPGARDPTQDLAILREVLVAENGLQSAPVGRASLNEIVLHGVTSNRRGIPLSLSLAWILVARRAGLPVVGLDTPEHFLLRYCDPDRIVIVDAYNGGSVSDPGLVRRLMIQRGYPPPDFQTLEASDLDMLLRTLRNLGAASGRLGDPHLRDTVVRVLRRLGQLSAS